MSAETVRIDFQYRVGEIVRYEGTRWFVIERRYHEGIVAPYIQYALTPTPYRLPYHFVWAYEPDIQEATP